MRIGPYEVLGELGRGGMGVVYRARHTELGRPVALKVLAPGAASTPALAARFRREAQAAAGLAAHPGIVGVHDVGEAVVEQFTVDSSQLAAGRRLSTDNRQLPTSPIPVLYLAMDLVEGQSLETLAEAGDLAPVEIAGLGAQVARALAHAHARGVRHRDVKPANVLVGRRSGGEPVGSNDRTVAAPDSQLSTVNSQPATAFLADFGLAAVHAADARTTRLTRSGEIVGTAAYMPPEQARGDALDDRADLYALGATLYHVCAGAPPFPGDSLYEVLAALLRDDAPPLRDVAPAIPADLAAVIDRCLARDPADRYATATALADDLERFVRREPTLARPRPAAMRWLAAVRRRRAVLAAAGAVAAAVAAGAWALRASDPRRDAALASTHGARTDAERATALAAAWGRLQRDGGAALRRLEDAWHGAPVAPAAVDAALAEVRGAAATLRADAPHLAAAITALAGCYAGLPEADARLRAAGGAAAADPLARLCLARAHLSTYARVVAEPPVLIAPYSVEVRRFRESARLIALRQDADRAIAAARASPLWPLLPGVADVQAYAAAAARFATDTPAAAARALAPLADDPTFGTEALFLAGTAFVLAEDHAAAAVAFERAAIREWGDARRAAAMAWFAVGSVPGGSPDALAKAITHLDARLAVAPDDLSALSRRAAIRRRRGEMAMQAGADAGPDLRAARVDLDIAVRLAPADAAVRHGRGVLAELLAEVAWSDPAAAATEADAAVAELVEAERLAPDDPSAPAARIGAEALRARLLRERGADPQPALDAALAVAARLLARWPDYRPALVARAMARRTAAEVAAARGQDDGDMLAGARADWDAALVIFPDDPQALGERANVFHTMAERAEARGEDARPMLASAVADVERALRVDARRPDLWHVCGNLRLAAAESIRGHGGDPRAAFAAALDAYDRALALADRPDARVARGTAHASAADAAIARGEDPGPQFDLAQADYDAALAIAPEDSGAYYDRGGLWLARADRAKTLGADPGPALAAALADYDAAVARRPDGWENHSGRAAVLVELGRIPEAIAAFEQALTRNPAAPGVREALQDLARRGAR